MRLDVQPRTDARLLEREFFLEYLGNPVGEHMPPGQTYVCTSTNGRDWSKPTVVFPPYPPPPGTELPKGATGYMMHQRMGFYAAPNGRLLVLAFYGHAENPFGQGGIGRVVREAHTDGSFGPIYFIRYGSHTKWNESNTSYPRYTKSDDHGFVEACEALLANKLMTLQWWDEDRGLDGFYSVKRAGSALSFFHRKDGNVVDRNIYDPIWASTEAERLICKPTGRTPGTSSMSP